MDPAYVTCCVSYNQLCMLLTSPAEWSLIHNVCCGFACSIIPKCIHLHKQGGGGRLLHWQHVVPKHCAFCFGKHNEKDFLFIHHRTEVNT